jgi:hypothetical protein
MPLGPRIFLKPRIFDISDFLKQWTRALSHRQLPITNYQLPKQEKK